MKDDILSSMDPVRNDSRVVVTLAPLHPSHLDHVLTWVNDRRVMRYFASHQVDISRQDEAAFIERIVASETDHVFSIFSGEQYVGQCALHHEGSEARLFIAICFEHQKRGYASEAIRQLVDFAWDELKLARITLLVRVDNHHAKAMYLRLGFHLDGLQKQAYKLGDTLLDMLRMSIDNPRSSYSQGSRPSARSAHSSHR